MATTAFGKAFRAARDAGDKEFEFGGKKYNTKFKEETSAPASEAPEAPAGNPKLNSLRETKPRNFDPAQNSSEIIAQKMKNSLNRQLDDDKAEKKAADTAKSQAIIDRLSKRTKPYMKDEAGGDMKRGGAVKKMASGGSVSSASSRGDGIAQRGKTRGKMC